MFHTVVDKAIALLFIDAKVHEGKDHLKQGSMLILYMYAHCLCRKSHL